MFKKVVFGVPLLCLALQSTGQAASAAMKEMIEFSIPAARRALSTVRPLSSLLFTFQPPVPMAPPSSHVIKRYFSKILGPLADVPKTLPVLAVETATPLEEDPSFASPKVANVSDESKEIKDRSARKRSIRIGGGEFMRQFEICQKNCFPTLKGAFPEYVGCLDEIESALYLFYVDPEKTIEGMSYSNVTQLRESAEQWHAISPHIIDEIKKETNLQRQRELQNSKDGIDWLFTNLTKINPPMMVKKLS